METPIESNESDNNKKKTNPWTPELLSLKERIEKKFEYHFNCFRKMDHHQNQFSLPSLIAHYER
ncbi:hypothetical protein [Chryseobacterium sp. 7]|uniref:hypothetical protein n=1 Tax=Chryseobacterium sp. 7 TaxID=2035214 RepID=UPI0011C49E8C|nr:hypothetical protein [Chryseobacterium sp. 7]